MINEIAGYSKVEARIEEKVGAGINLHKDRLARKPDTSSDGVMSRRQGTLAGEGRYMCPVWFRKRRLVSAKSWCRRDLRR